LSRNYLQQEKIRNLARGSAGVVLLLAAGFPVAPADAGGAGGNCSLETLKGQYLGPASGTVFPPAFGVSEPAVSEATGYSIFNRDGTGTDYVTFTINGVVIFEMNVTPFTYTLKLDCTGTRTVSNGPKFNIYAAFDGCVVTEIATAPVGLRSPRSPSGQAGQRSSSRTRSSARCVSRNFTSGSVPGAACSRPAMYRWQRRFRRGR
jgi:hypothetical protein